MVTAECNTVKVSCWTASITFSLGVILRHQDLYFYKNMSPLQLCLPSSRSVRYNACLLLVMFFFVIQYDLNLIEFSSCCFFFRAVILICLWVVVV